jgi:hypothetical protein
MAQTQPIWYNARMAERIVYHGGAIETLAKVSDGHHDLFGVAFTDAPDLSAALTDDYAYAEICALTAVIRDGFITPVVLEYSIPEEDIIPLGPIHGHETILGYRTKDTVDPGLLTPEYLALIGIPVEEAIRRVAHEGVEFYRIPSAYYRNLHLVHVDFKQHEMLRQNALSHRRATQGR